MDAHTHTHTFLDPPSPGGHLVGSFFVSFLFFPQLSATSAFFFFHLPVFYSFFWTLWSFFFPHKEISLLSISLPFFFPPPLFTFSPLPCFSSVRLSLFVSARLLCVALCLYLCLTLPFPPSLFSWLSDHFSSNENRHPSPFSVLSLLPLLLWQSSYQRNDNTTSLCNLAEEGCGARTHTHTHTVAKNQCVLFSLCHSPPLLCSFFFYPRPTSFLSFSLCTRDLVACVRVTQSQRSPLMSHRYKISIETWPCPSQTSISSPFPSFISPRLSRLAFLWRTAVCSCW